MPDRGSALRLVLALALLGPVALAAPAHASPPPGSFEYDALGDSYASGYGVPPYEECGRSDAAYPVQLDGRMRIRLDDFAACAGATTTSLLAEGQLEALDADTDLVTISIGGNDIGWYNVVAACLGGEDADCQAAIRATRTRITDVLPGLLEPVYAQLATAAPNAHVVVTGYPRLFSPESGDYYRASPAEQQELNDGADLLNEVIARTAREHRFQFVDVTRRFLGHGANSEDPWLIDARAPGSLHPNEAGYAAYTAAVTAAVRPARLRHELQKLQQLLAKAHAWFRERSHWRP